MDTLTKVKRLLYALVGEYKSLQAVKQLLLKAGSYWSKGEEWFTNEAQQVIQDYTPHLLPKQIQTLEDLVKALTADLKARSLASDEYRLLAFRIGTKILFPEDLEQQMIFFSASV